MTPQLNKKIDTHSPFWDAENQEAHLEAALKGIITGENRVVELNTFMERTESILDQNERSIS